MVVMNVCTPFSGKDARELNTVWFLVLWHFMALTANVLCAETRIRLCEELHLSYFFLTRVNGSSWRKLKFKLRA